MKKSIFKKIGAIALTAMLAGSIGAIAGCDSGAGGGSSKYAGKILIGVQQTRGNNYEAMCKFLDALKPELDFDYQIAQMSYSDSSNLTTIENAILKGAIGIITMTEMEMGYTQQVIELCEQEEVYYAGYMSDFWKTYANPTTGKAPKASKYCLGSVSDGELDTETTATWLFDAVKESPYRKIVLTRSPDYAYPSSVESAKTFKNS